MISRRNFVKTVPVALCAPTSAIAGFLDGKPEKTDIIRQEVLQHFVPLGATEEWMEKMIFDAKSVIREKNDHIQKDFLDCGFSIEETESRMKDCFNFIVGKIKDFAEHCKLEIEKHPNVYPWNTRC